MRPRDTSSRDTAWLRLNLVGPLFIVAALASGCGSVGQSDKESTGRGEETGAVTAEDMLAVTFHDPGGHPSAGWAQSIKSWLADGDDSHCNLGIAQDFAKGPRAAEFGTDLDLMYVYGPQNGESPRAACDARVRSGEDARAFLVAVELFDDADAALADWDAEVGGANDDGEVLRTYRRTEPHGFLDGTIWISCWNDFDRPGEERNCNAHWFYEGVLLEGELSSGLDPDPTPQEAADWFAAALPGIVGANDTSDLAGELSDDASRPTEQGGESSEFSDCRSTFSGTGEESPASYELFERSTVVFGWNERVVASQYYLHDSPTSYAIAEPEPYDPGDNPLMLNSAGYVIDDSIDGDVEGCAFKVVLEVTAPLIGERDGDTVRYDPNVFPIARNGRVVHVYIDDPDAGTDPLDVDVPEGESVEITWAFVAPADTGEFEVLGPATTDDQPRAKVTG